MKTLAKFRVQGTVQGVGFRPFVHRLAKAHGLSGYVMNTPRGVEMALEGQKDEILRLRRELVGSLPPLAEIRSLDVTFSRPRGYRDFRIRLSSMSSRRLVRGETLPDSVLLPADVATCPECMAEVMDPLDRRYSYPFTNCTNCGPRFSIIEETPYDRTRTSMRKFKMCPTCRAEYENIENRRYHAEPNACPACGPKVRLLDANGRATCTRDPIREAGRALRDGAIIAVKGIGGFHLACDAASEKEVTRLRKRKGREGKPFAIMMRDIETVRQFAELGVEEERLLSNSVRPIVLVRKRNDVPKEKRLAKSLATGIKDLGVMLPYTPLHMLLMQHGPEAIVLTSGNYTDEPIATTIGCAVQRLKGVADLFLVHDRDIVNRSDDPVVAVFRNAPLVLRRSRGYAPQPVSLPFNGAEVLAVGGELKNTFCLVRGQEAFLSQHIGDLKDVRTDDFFLESLVNYVRMFGFNPIAIAHDLHPNYLSTLAARELAKFQKSVELIPVQHHHAHIVSTMAERGIGVEGKVIGLAYDGTGFGPDGAVWGGEVLVATYDSFERYAHLRYVALPGADRASVEPWRMAVSHLYDTFGPSFLRLRLPLVEKVTRKTCRALTNMIERRINSPLTSSLGRLFDAVSALLGIAMRNSYEAEAAMLLENAADAEAAGVYPFVIDGGEIDAREAIRAIVEDLKKATAVPVISMKFHRTVASFSLEACRKARGVTGLNRVVLGGGCFQNRLLLGLVLELLEKDGFEAFYPQRVPPNDGGLSLGQAASAAYILRRRRKCA